MRRSSAQGVLYGQTVANVAGIANSDLECMDILYLEGRVTAGRLADVTGLTTGASPPRAPATALRAPSSLTRSASYLRRYIS
jgi:polyphosphate kinase 2 (PPK2 family)